MDIERILRSLHEQGLLSQLEDKRLTTPKLPTTLYLKLLIAAIATGKTRGGLGQTIQTALHTYVNRNNGSHIGEFHVEAIKQGRDVEDIIVDAIVQHLAISDSDDA